MPGYFAVYFKSGACDMDAAVRTLHKHGLQVTPQEGYVTVTRPGAPEFDVGLATQPWVREEAAGVARRNPRAAALCECDARFEVSFENSDAALDEFNTMMEVQAALQEVSDGFLFLSWNGHVAGPGM